MLTDIIEWARLPFRKDKQLRLSLYRILGFYPHNIAHYELALMHKSMAQRNEKGRPLNNERLEFLGDAILDATVGDIVYRHFPGKREGFLTTVRSKLVKRETLNRLADEMGITTLLHANSRRSSHNSYVGGNTFEALVGAIYIDRGYNACMRFVEKRILKQILNIDKVAYKESNFKSRLIEWCQKNRVKLEFRILEQTRDKSGNPIFSYAVLLEDVEGATGTGYSKKESQQQASKVVLAKLRKEPQFIDQVFASKKLHADERGEQTGSQIVGNEMKESEVCVDPTWENGHKTVRTETPKDDVEAPKDAPTTDENAALTPAEPTITAAEETSTVSDEAPEAPLTPTAKNAEEHPSADEDLDFDDITLRRPDKEEIIARAEEIAFAEHQD